MGPTTGTDAGARMKATTVASAVHRVQMALYDGAAASREPLLRGAASLLSGPDYADVVTERSIADACGYPACPNPLPSESAEAARGKAAAPRFRISLRGHRVYDLEEARKFCSERCLVASAAFAASLPPDRPFGVPPDRLDALVALFGGGGGGGGGGGDDGSALGFGASGDGKGEVEGRKVEIREKEASGPGEVTLQEWIGPSDAIEGYVPRRDRIVGGPKKEAKQNNACSAEQFSNINVDSRNAASGESGMVLSENTKTKKKEATKTPLKMFKQDEDNDMLSSCISDSIAKQLEDVVLEEKKDKKKKKAAKGTSRAGKSKPAKRPVGRNGHEVDFTSTFIMGDHGSELMEHGALGQYNFSSSMLANEQPSSSQHAVMDSVQAYTEELHELFSNAVNIAKDETSDDSGRRTLKSSLKAVGSKNARRSVKWADENGSVLEKSRAFVSHSSDNKQSREGMDSSVRRESAEACAAALIEAAEAISSGTSEVEDAVSKAGIIILPDMVNQQQYDNDYDNDKDAGENEIFEIDRGVVKWPRKTVLLDTDMFDVDDSWHDTPPEGFSLTLSPFATMWAALFGWVSLSSLAYVYGLDESSMEDLLIAGGRECPQKRVLNDGHSSEIRRALDTCVCNALPVLVSNLRMQIPVSKLEITLGYLMDTMSFVDALPSLRSRQWQMMVLVLLDALSVHRLPALAPIMSDSRLLQKLLNSAQVSREEYGSMIDLLLPFGRSTQSQASLPS